MIPCIFLRDKNILLCTMSGRTLKTKTVGAEKQILSSNLWFEHLGFFSRSFLLCDVFYIDILMYWFSFRGLCCMPTLPENCNSFSHRLVCSAERGWRCLRLVGVYIHQVRENCTRSFSITKIILRGRHAELSPLARGGTLSHSVVVVSLLSALLLSSLWKKVHAHFHS